MFAKVMRYSAAGLSPTSKSPGSKFNCQVYPVFEP